MLSIRYSCQVLLKFEVYRSIFRKNIQMSDFMKIRPVEAEMFRVVGETDGQTDTWRKQ